MSSRHDAFAQAENLRGQADAAQRRADTAATESASGAARQESHTLRNAAASAYARAGVRLTPIGTPFTSDIPKKQSN